MKSLGILYLIKENTWLLRKFIELNTVLQGVKQLNTCGLRGGGGGGIKHKLWTNTKEGERQVKKYIFKKIILWNLPN